MEVRCLANRNEGLANRSEAGGQANFGLVDESEGLGGRAGQGSVDKSE